MRTEKFGKNAHSVLTFRKWGRKNYSLFLTLHKTVVIASLSVTYLLSTPVESLAVTQDTTEVKMEYDLDEIEVSAQRAPALYSQVARIISVIERKEIEAIPAESVQDLLEYIAGVDVRQRGAEGVQADVSIRGGSFDQTLILLNGINITDPQTGHHNLNFPVSLDQIERIEILEGPAARVYGPNAFSGAVNIITKEVQSDGLRAAISSGSFGYFNGSLSGTIKGKNSSHLLAVGGKRSDGYITNTDFKELTGFYSNEINTGAGDLSFQLGLAQKGFGANSFYTPVYPNQYEATKTLFTSLKWQGDGTLHLTPLVYYRRHQDRFELFRNNPADWYGGHNHHLTNVYGANLNSWINWSLGKTAFGVEFRSEHILSNVLGTEMDNPKDVPGEDAAFTKSDDRNTTSAFLEHSFYVDKWIFTGGIMANHISGSDLGINVFPGVDASYQFFEGGKLFTSYNTSLRMPTFTDLYYQGPTNIGNPELEPERSSTTEIGMKINQELFKGYAVVFYRHGKDIIDWVKEDETSEIWQPRNLTEINNLGIEVQGQLLFRNKFGNFYPNISASYLYNNLEKVEADFISNYALDYLKHKCVVALNQQLMPDLFLDLRMVYQDRNGTYTKYEDASIVGEVTYAPFLTVDCKINYKLKRLNIFASANNLFDMNYNDVGNVPQPRRWFKAGIAYQVDFK